jgi:hypothetical protein
LGYEEGKEWNVDGMGKRWKGDNGERSQEIKI